MKAHFKDIYYAAREICKGSGNINLLSIGLITGVVYIAYLLLVNRELFFLLTSIKGREDYESIDIYIYQLQSFQIQNINVLIPAVVSFILFIGPSQQIKKNMQNRLLPTAPWVRIISLLLVTFTIAATSATTTYLLDQGIIAYTRYRFMPELTLICESMGHLYRQIPDMYILSTDYQYPTPFGLWVICVFLIAPTIILITLNVNLIFQRHSSLKGVFLVFSVVFVGLLLHDNIRPIPSSVISTTVNWTPTIYFLVLLISLTLSLFYLFKEREG